MSAGASGRSDAPTGRDRVKEAPGASGLTPSGDLPTDEARWAEDPRWRDVIPLDLTGTTHLLVVAAHPDDETLGLGGLLAGLPADVDLDVVVATDGQASHPRSPTHTPADLARIRRAEACEVIALLAPRARLHLLGLADGGLTDEQDELTAALVRLVRPGESVLLAPYRCDGHPDHEAAARSAAAAAWRSDGRLLEYPVWLWHWEGPDALPWDQARRVDLSDEVRERKARAVAGHRSQVEPLSDRPGDEVLLRPDMLAHFARPWETLLLAEPGESSPFEDLHAREEDPWEVRTSWYERRKRALTLAALPHERYAVGVEVGCSVGALADDLLGRCDAVVAVDESSPPRWAGSRGPTGCGRCTRRCRRSGGGWRRRSPGSRWSSWCCRRWATSSRPGGCGSWPGGWGSWSRGRGRTGRPWSPATGGTRSSAGR
ncbi:PIG-L deacetylase family protein [Ornithinimicrobium sp. W1665]|uniref:PIG-L deacetylase family protein n=1 Tax=Ornithinimicrobium sp. W1665 TaxID=3416666 RepID=UPI003D6C074A